MILLIIVILGVAIFCFYKGYILAGIICLAGFSGKFNFLPLVLTSIYLFYKGNIIIGIPPIVPHLLNMGRISTPRDRREHQNNMQPLFGRHGTIALIVWNIYGLKLLDRKKEYKS